MELALLILALLGALAVAVCVVLFLRLRKKEDQIKAVLEQPRMADGLSAPYELAAIDQYLYDRCCRYMTEFRPFLVTSFNLQDLANAVYTNKYYLSKTIKILCYFLIVCVIIYIKLKSNDYLSMT